MKPIQLQITITPSEDTVADLLELLSRIQGIAAIDEKREARVRASQHAHFGGQKPPEDRGLLIDMKELAKLLGVSPKTVYRLKDAGKIPKPIKIGNAMRWSYDEIKEWIGQGCPSQRQVRKR